MVLKYKYSWKFSSFGCYTFDDFIDIIRWFHPICSLKIDFEKSVTVKINDEDIKTNFINLIPKFKLEDDNKFVDFPEGLNTGKLKFEGTTKDFLNKYGKYITQFYSINKLDEPAYCVFVFEDPYNYNNKLRICRNGEIKKLFNETPMIFDMFTGFKYDCSREKPDELIERLNKDFHSYNWKDYRKNTLLKSSVVVKKEDSKRFLANA